MMSLYPKPKRQNNRSIAVYDIETTTDLQRVYMVGYYDGNQYRFWETKPLPPTDEHSALALFLEWYFSNPRDEWLYAHNGGNFDNVFTLSWLLSQPTERFRAEVIPVQSCMLRLRVTRTESPKTYYDFLDSFRLLPASLNALAETFLGRGKVDIDNDYENLMRNPKRYEYLEADCKLLYDVIIMFRDKLQQEMGGTLSLSTAACALKTFQQGYQKKMLHSGTPESDRISRDAYYGGRCEIFRKS